MNIKQLAAWTLLLLVSIAGLLYAPMAFAQVPAAPSFMDKVVAFLNGLVPLVAGLNGFGLIIKYMPVKFLAYINDDLIPLCKALIVFLGTLGGSHEVVSLITGATPAQAGLFSGLGDLGAQLTGMGKLGLALTISALSRNVFEGGLRALVEKGLKLKKNQLILD